MIERDSVQSGDTTIEYEVRHSVRRRKTVQISVDRGDVRVAAPATTPDSELRGHRSQTGRVDTQPYARGRNAGGRAQAIRQRRDTAIPGSKRQHGR